MNPFYARETRGAAALLCFSVAVTALSADTAFAQTQLAGGQIRIITNLQTGTTYSVVPSDCGKLLSLSNATGTAVTLPPAGTSGLNAGCWIDIENTGTGAAAFTATASLIDGAPSFSLTTNQGLRLISNGSGYFTQRGQGQGSGTSGGGGALTFQSGGVALGQAATMNVAAGTGVSCIPQVSAGVMTFQCNADTSYLATKAGLQGAGNPQICTSSSANGAAYSAGCATPLGAYAAKQTLFWFADVANTSATPTLNIDTLGAKTLVHHDGSALALNDIKAGALYRIWYDGANMRVVEAGLGSGGGSTPAGNPWVSPAAPVPIVDSAWSTYDMTGCAYTVTSGVVNITSGNSARICGRTIATGAAPYTHDYAVYIAFQQVGGTYPEMGAAFTDGTKVSECGVSNNNGVTSFVNGNKWGNSTTYSGTYTAAIPYSVPGAFARLRLTDGVDLNGNASPGNLYCGYSPSGLPGTWIQVWTDKDTTAAGSFQTPASTMYFVNPNNSPATQAMQIVSYQ